MKTIKQTIAGACAALLALFCLTACGEAPEEPIEVIRLEPASAYSTPPKAEADGGIRLVSTAGEGTIAPLTRGTQSGYYYTDILHPFSATLLYIDYAAGTEAPLCSETTCAHKDEGCTAYFGLDENMAQPDPLVWQGKLLYLEGALFSGDVAFKTMEPDGSNRQTLCEFPDNWMIISEPVYADGPVLYMYVNEYNAAARKGTEEPRRLLMAFDLDSGSARILMDFGTDGYPVQVIYSAIGRKLILSELALTPKDECLETYYALDVDTGGRMDIVQRWEEEGGSFVVGEYYYEQNTAACEIRRTSLRTGEQQSRSYAPVCAGLSAGSLHGMFVEFEGTMRVSLRDFERDTFEEYILDWPTGEMRKLTLLEPFRGHPVNILAENGETLLVLRDYSRESPGPSGLIREFVPQHALLPKADYAASRPNYTDITAYR